MRVINVHLALDDSAVDFCRQVNAQIRRLTHSLIAFDRTSNLIPHVSLVVGSLKESAGLSRIACHMDEIASGFSRFRLLAHSPYLGKSGNFVLARVDVPCEFTELRGRIEEVLASEMCEQHKHTSEPHLTLGYVEKNAVAALNHVRSLVRGTELWVEAVQLCDAGTQGTCSNVLYRFPLRGSLA